MVALYLIAAHLVGDFVLQTRWQAGRKLIDRAARARHVAAYCVPFVPIAVVYAHQAPYGWSGPRGLYACQFLFGVAFFHYWTDSRRFTSTLGDVLAWRFRLARRDHLIRIGGGTKLGANPWAPLPILLDQTLHAVQLAVLGGLFLS